MCCHCTSHPMNRRQFMVSSALGVAGASLLTSGSAFSQPEAWNPDAPLKISSKKLIIKPALIYDLYKRREARSWRPWGGLHTEENVKAEENRINRELREMQQQADFPLEIRPLTKIRSKEDALAFEQASDYDVPLIYAASGGTDKLEASVSNRRHNLFFLRHRSGPIYLWYEIMHNRFLRKGGLEFELDTYRNPGGTTVHDVVVDDYNEVLQKLRVLYGIKNFIGQRVVAVGGTGGWCCPKAPLVAQEKYKLDLQTVDYQILEQRIQQIFADKKSVRWAEKATHAYLAVNETELNTEKQFVVNGFLLYRVFKDLLQEYETNAFTIKECMTTVIPMSQTTACLPLSLLNDEGYMAFCESDFNVIPAGILLHYLSGKPVFLNDPTFPHHGLVTAAHCTAPRRMDGKNYAAAKIVTHYESDYGATPKVELPLGTQISMICPDSRQKEWLGFTGTIEENPFYDICRSQYDIRIEGNWRKLLEDHRGFHWMMACGNVMSEMEYACRKIGVDWLNTSAAV